MALKEIKHWVLRCYGCYTVCKEMGRLFCQNCGNSTLQRVTSCVDKEGNVVIGSFRKIKLRGLRYTAPPPKGGKRANNLIVSESQLPRNYYKYNNRGKKGSKTSETTEDNWGVRNGKSNHRKFVVGYGRRNPNESNRRIGKNNKPVKPGY